MKTRGWLLGALVAGILVFAVRGGCLGGTPAPDERLAGQLDALCDIARHNIATPEQGVRTLGRYLGKHVGEMAGELGDTIATIEKIPDDRRHDDRARVARDRIRKPLRACQRVWMEFGQAVQDDPAATALVERFSVRLNRTLEILFGQGLDMAALPGLPARLEQRLDERLR